MKDKIAYLALILALIALIFTLSHEDSNKNGVITTKESTYERVLRTQEIRCAYAPNPPTLIKDPNTGTLSGIFYDVMTEAGRRLSLKINWVEEVGYGVIAEGFATDRYDAFCTTVWPTAERSRAASFTIPIYYSPVGIMVRADDHRFDNDYLKLDDPAIRLSVRDGDISDSFAQAAFPRAKRIGVSELSDTVQQLDEVAHGKADATITEPALLFRYLEANPGTLINIAERQPLRVSPNTIMIKPNDYQFKVMLDVTLQELLNSGFINKTLAKYQKGPVFMPIALPYRTDSTSP